jgi:3',5'-cyclic AMP phosphodiesterase CpdA
LKVNNVEENNSLVIVHLSDIHCGPKFQGRTLQNAIDEINALAPDVVAVTGDLTEDGLIEEFQEAKRYLQQLRCSRIVISSGNHDARTTGYRLFSRLFGEPSSITTIKNTVIINLNSSRPDQDGGEIGYRQRLWLKDGLDRYADRFKIVTFHHHLIPIPDTGMEKNMICDAGDVLWTLISHGADVVLCGHRHRPWIWTAGTLRIIHAGAVSTNRLRGFYQNSYNIVRIEAGQIHAYLKIVGEQEVDLTPTCLKDLKPPIRKDTELFPLAANERTTL